MGEEQCMAGKDGHWTKYSQVWILLNYNSVVVAHDETKIGAGGKDLNVGDGYWLWS